MNDPSVNGADVFPSPTPNTSLVATGIGDLATRATFLAFFIILGVVGNSVLVVTIAQSTRLRGKVLNLLIINVSIVNLLDCFGNMPLILGSAIREHWDYGTFICNFNAFLMQLVSIGIILGLLLMTTDRFLAAKHPDDYPQRLTRLRANVLIVYSWIHATAFSFPLVLGKSIPVAAFPARYSCSIKAGAPLLYVALTSIISILIPFILIISFYIYIINKGVREKMKRKQGPAAIASNYQNEPRLWVEINASKYVGVLVVLWAIFQGPYLVLTYIEQYKSTSELESATLLNFSYPWEMDLAFTWMKLSYSIFLPLVTFGWKKEVWQKFKNFILCRKSNLIVDSSPKGSPKHRVTGNRQGSGNSAMASSIGVPVIFATEDGLHVQKYEKRGHLAEEEGELGYSDSDYTIVNGSQVLTARKCDIIGSQDLMQLREDDDTSDYDSQGDIDPNAVSLNSNGKVRHQSRQNSETVLVQADEISENYDCLKKSTKEKKKQKRIVKTISEEEIIPNRNNSERGSHDSGRGSMEKQSKKKREKQQILTESHFDKTENTQETSVYSQSRENVLEQVDERPAFQLGDELYETPEPPQIRVIVKKNKKKEKKKKNHLKRMVIEQNITKPIPSDINEVLGGATVRPVPPPRLKPLEEANRFAIKHDSVTDAADVIAGDTKSRPSSVLSESKTCINHPGLGGHNIVDSTIHKGLEDDPSSLKHKDGCENVTVNNTNQRCNSGSASRPAPRKDRHLRKGTSDSQTTLLSSSSSSVEYRELLVLTSKAVSENVHITPKSPDPES